MDRTKYIIVFQDITKANPEWGEWGNFFKGYLVADNLISAELMAKMIRGAVVGAIDDMAKMIRGAVVGAIDDDGDECYFEDDMESVVKENVQSLPVFNDGVQLRKKKN